MGRKEEKVGAFSESSGRRVTLARIAEELDVSAMTVSNAYNHPDRLSGALRERVFETAGRLGYHGPDPVGRSLRRQRTDVVGVLYSNPLSYAFEDPAAVRAAASSSTPTSGTPSLEGWSTATAGNRRSRAAASSGSLSLME